VQAVEKTPTLQLSVYNKTMREDLKHKRLSNSQPHKFKCCHDGIQKYQGSVKEQKEKEIPFNATMLRNTSSNCNGAHTPSPTATEATQNPTTTAPSPSPTTSANVHQQKLPLLHPPPWQPTIFHSDSRRQCFRLGWVEDLPHAY